MIGSLGELSAHVSLRKCSAQVSPRKISVQLSLCKLLRAGAEGHIFAVTLVPPTPPRRLKGQTLILGPHFLRKMLHASFLMPVRLCNVLRAFSRAICFALSLVLLSLHVLLRYLLCMSSCESCSACAPLLLALLLLLALHVRSRYLLCMCSHASCSACAVLRNEAGKFSRKNPLQGPREKHEKPDQSLHLLESRGKIYLEKTTVVIDSLQNQQGKKVFLTKWKKAFASYFARVASLSPSL